MARALAKTPGQTHIYIVAILRLHIPLGEGGGWGRGGWREAEGVIWVVRTLENGGEEAGRRREWMGRPRGADGGGLCDVGTRRHFHFRGNFKDVDAYALLTNLPWAEERPAADHMPTLHPLPSRAARRNARSACNKRRDIANHLPDASVKALVIATLLRLVIPVVCNSGPFRV